MFGWIVVTLVLDVMTWYYAKDLKLYDDEEDGGEDGKDKDSKDRDSGFQVTQYMRSLPEYHSHSICNHYSQDIELNESKPDSYHITA